MIEDFFNWAMDVVILDFVDSLEVTIRGRIILVLLAPLTLPFVLAVGITCVLLIPIEIVRWIVKG